MTLLAMLVVGILALGRLPLAFLPTQTSARISVRVNMNRTAPEVLEREVIRPLEEEVAGLKDMKLMRVSSGSWGVRMSIELAAGSDMDARKLELREKLERVRPKLPSTVQRIEVGSSMGNEDAPAMRIRIASDRDLTQDYTLIDEHVVRVLERLDGVANVTLGGVSPHELEIAMDPKAASRSGIALSRISESVRSAQQARSLGTIATSPNGVSVRVPAIDADTEAFEELSVPRAGRATTSNGAATGVSSTDPTFVADPTRPLVAGDPTLPVGATSNAASTTVSSTALVTDVGTNSPATAYLREVARVTRHPVEERSGHRLNGRGAINVEVYAQAGASLVTLSQEVRAALAKMNEDTSLGALEITVFEDQGEEVVDTLADLRNSGLYGGAIALLVLLAFLKRIRPTLVAASCIPLSVLFTCAVLFFRGDELNCIVMLGLVIGVGMVVDNAVVIVESIQTARAEFDDPEVAVRIGARRVSLATMASTLSSVIVFLPLMIGSRSNPMSVYFEPLGATFVISLLASLFASQCAVPLVLGRFPGPPRPPARAPITDRLALLYGYLIRFSLRRPRVAVFFGLLICASVAWPLTQARYKFGGFDDADDGVPIELELLAGRDYQRSLMHVRVLEDALLPRMEGLGIATLSCNYRDWGASCDVRPATGFQNEGERRAFQKALTDALPVQSGVRYRVDERDRWRRKNDDPHEVEFAIKGEDMGTLVRLSEEVAEHLSRTIKKGSADHPEEGGYDQIYGPFNEGTLELHVTLLRDRMMQLGLRASSVADQVSLAFEGVSLGEVSAADGQVSLRLSTGSVDSAEIPGIAELRDLKIALPSGAEVSLGGIAEISIERSPWWLQRVNRETEVRVRVRFFREDAEANKNDVDNALASFRFPVGYKSGEGTQWWRDEAGETETMVNLALCLLLVYAVVASLFESLLMPLVLLGICLLGCFGAPWAMWATDTTIDTVAMVGMFILVGIVVNNGIMLVDAVMQLRAEGMPRNEALETAGRQRLRPILMTAATTILGLVPMLIHHPTLAGVYYHAIAIVIAGGLLSSTMTTLLVLPAAYALVEDFGSRAAYVWARVSGQA